MYEDFELIIKVPKGITMSQVQFSATFTVTAAASPLTISPNSGAFNLTVGVPADGTAVATVSGGTPPYTYSIDPASGPLPTGISFVEDASTNSIVTLAGTPTVAGTSTTPVLLDVNDSAGATAQLASRFKAIK